MERTSGIEFLYHIIPNLAGLINSIKIVIMLYYGKECLHINQSDRISRVMRTHYVLSLLLACSLMAGCAAPLGAPETPAPVFRLTAEGNGNELTVSTEGETAIVDVQSQSGIGSATIKLVSGEFPENIVLRLHIQGLEEFSLSYNETTITASVSSSDSRSVFQSVASPEEGERPITPDSPSWLDITIVSDQATPHIPLDQGYFEITLPKGLLTEADSSFSIQWIDFYR